MSRYYRSNNSDRLLDTNPNKRPQHNKKEGKPTQDQALTERLSPHKENVEGAKVPTGSLDITFYRDDIDDRPKPMPKDTDMPVDISGKTIVLVDDVLFTGRTVRAAMDALIDFGRPKKIELAVLIDRGDRERELPIMANYVGGEWSTDPNETVNVYLQESGAEDHVTIEKKEAA